MFRCPDCGRGSALQVTQSLELASDARSDDITLQICSCGRCPFQGVGIYQESRRGSLDSESWEHFGYRIPSGPFNELRAVVASCPDPKNSRCECDAHRLLGRRDERGYWILPQGIDRRSRFVMKVGQP